MGSTGSSVSIQMPARRLLAILATIAILTVLGRFVGDAAYLWLETSSPVVTNQDVQHTNLAGMDTTFSFHSGFEAAVLRAVAAPTVFVTLQVFARPFSLFQFSFSPLRPPKAG
jgi:hypothetical protein